MYAYRILNLIPVHRNGDFFSNSSKLHILAKTESDFQRISKEI